MGSFAMPVVGKKGYGKLTANAGTKIVRLIEPVPNGVPHLLHIAVTTSTTAHLLTVMRPINKTTVASAAAAGQAVINITADPGNFTGIRGSDNTIAGGDYCVYQCSDGTWFVDTVASVATLAITMTTNVPFAVSAGAPFWWFGVETDVNVADPTGAAAHNRYNLAVSSLNQFGDPNATAGFDGAANGIFKTGSLLHADMESGMGHPLILVIDNGTAASTIETTTVVWSDRAQTKARLQDLTL